MALPYAKPGHMTCGLVLCPMALFGVLWSCPMSYGPVQCPTYGPVLRPAALPYVLRPCPVSHGPVLCPMALSYVPWLCCPMSHGPGPMSYVIRPKLQHHITAGRMVEH